MALGGRPLEIPQFTEEKGVFIAGRYHASMDHDLIKVEDPCYDLRIVCVTEDVQEKGIFSKLLVAKKLRQMDFTEDKETELSRLRDLREHENIVNIECIAKCSESYWLFMEWCPLGTLEDYYSKLGAAAITREMSLGFIVQIGRGLNYLHSNNIIHSNVLPTSIVISQSAEGGSVLHTAKLTDISLCKLLARSKDPEMDQSRKLSMSSKCPPREFDPPESFDRRKKREYTKSADTYAFGVLALAMIDYGRNDYMKLYPPQCISNIENGRAQLLKLNNRADTGNLADEMVGRHESTGLWERDLKEKVIKQMILAKETDRSRSSVWAPHLEQIYTEVRDRAESLPEFKCMQDGCEYTKIWKQKLGRLYNDENRFHSSRNHRDLPLLNIPDDENNVAVSEPDTSLTPHLSMDSDGDQTPNSENLDQTPDSENLAVNPGDGQAEQSGPFFEDLNLDQAAVRGTAADDAAYTRNESEDLSMDYSLDAMAPSMHPYNERHGDCDENGDEGSQWTMKTAGNMVKHEWMMQQQKQGIKGTKNDYNRIEDEWKRVVYRDIKKELECQPSSRDIMDKIFERLPKGSVVKVKPLDELKQSLVDSKLYNALVTKTAEYKGLVKDVTYNGRVYVDIPIFGCFYYPEAVLELYPRDDQGPVEKGSVGFVINEPQKFEQYQKDAGLWPERAALEKIGGKDVEVKDLKDDHLLVSDNKKRPNEMWISRKAFIFVLTKSEAELAAIHAS